jgi:hypothetical protein
MPRAPRPPRRPASLSPPRPPRLGPLRLAPIRSEDSVALDQARTPRGGHELPPFVRFDRFLASWEWNQGEHLTSIGPTGSGKTVLNRYLLRRRDFVVVLGVKQRDPELYAPFERDGYEVVRRFDPEPPADVDRERLLFVPRTDKHGQEGRKARAAKFRQALNDIYDVGNWTVYADDIQYQADQLGLAPEFEELWMLGRSEGVSVVASSQEPVNIPLMAYGMATHLFLFRNNDLRRAQRMAELTGANREVTQHTILALPEHEFLYINRRDGRMVRSKVIRPAGA